jgi:hypothetical protein
MSKQIPCTIGGYNGYSQNKIYESFLSETNAPKQTEQLIKTVYHNNHVLINGDLTVIGGIFNPSDKNSKENIRYLDCSKNSDICENLLNLSPIQFNYINDAEKKPHFGFIAQEVEEHFPEIVNEIQDRIHNTPIKTVNYSEFIPLLVLTVQDMQSKITKLMNSNELLVDYYHNSLRIHNRMNLEITDLKQKLNELKYKINK